LSKSQPAFWSEVIDLRHIGGGESAQHILDVLKRIDAPALTGLDDAHDRRCSPTAFFGAFEKPIAPTNHHGLDASLTSVVANFNIRVIEVGQKRGPAVKRVRNCIFEFALWQLAGFHFVEPVFEHQHFRSCNSLAEMVALIFRKRRCNTFNVEEAFDQAHRKLCRFWVRIPCVLEAAMDVRHTGCSSGALSDDLVIFISAVGLQNASEPIKNFLRIERMFGIGIIVENIGVVSVAAIGPNEGPVRCSQALFDHRHCSSVGLHHSAFENVLFHFLDNWSKNEGHFFQPTAHGCTIYRKAQGFKHLLLPVKRQVQPKFIGSNFSKQARSSLTFVNWLARLFSGEHLRLALLTRIIECDVLKVFVERLNELKLVGDIKTYNFSRVSTARAGYLTGFSPVFYSACRNTFRRFRAAAAFVCIRDDIQSIFFFIKLSGVSARNYAKIISRGLQAKGVKKSAISRKAIAATKPTVDQFRKRSLASHDLVVLLFDGVHVGKRQIICGIGIDINGKKHVLGLRVGATENEVVCRDLIRDLIERGVSPTKDYLFVVDGSKALIGSIRAAFGPDVAIQRCQEHKIRDVQGYVPVKLRAGFRQRMQAAYNEKSEKKAFQRLAKIRTELSLISDNAVTSLTEGMYETLTVHRLGITGMLRKSLRTTNIIESAFSSVRRYMGRVSKFEDEAQRELWVTRSILETERHFRSLRGCRQLRKLREALSEANESRVQAAIKRRCSND
jgi:transposase-like protein